MRLLFSLLLLWLPFVSADAESGREAFRSTALPLPRFVTLRAGEVYARTGPGKNYPIRYVYQRKHMPVEVILEYEGWRKIRDHQGDEGWVHHTLLTGKRYGMIVASYPVTLYHKPAENSRAMAHIERGAIAQLEQCEKGQWCRIKAAGYKGWLKRTDLWGLYPQEFFD